MKCEKQTLPSNTGLDWLVVEFQPEPTSAQKFKNINTDLKQDLVNNTFNVDCGVTTKDIS